MTDSDTKTGGRSIRRFRINPIDQLLVGIFAQKFKVRNYPETNFPSALHAILDQNNAFNK